MAELDRLRPSHARRGAVSLVTTVQCQARSVVRKYRRQGRYSQLWRLKEMIPSLAQQQRMDEVDILEETARYILNLEQKLLEKVREHGLPEKLDKLKDNSAVSDDPSDNSAIDMDSLKSLLHRYAKPELRRRLDEQKIEDQKQIDRIVESKQEGKGSE
eukprot:GFUD01016914.1.p1 GENE.GFUD01016914.1~~GFUD01016914.1.p1  ORF type:complete len:158 (+),score=61.28 GFUD01016914.1:546-1019(+)